LDVFVIKSTPLKHPDKPAASDLGIELAEARRLALGQFAGDRERIAITVDIIEGFAGDVAFDAALDQFDHSTALAMMFVLGGGEGFGAGEAGIVEVAETV